MTHSNQIILRARTRADKLVVFTNQKSRIIEKGVIDSVTKNGHKRYLSGQGVTDFKSIQLQEVHNFWVREVAARLPDRLIPSFGLHKSSLMLSSLPVIKFNNINLYNKGIFLKN